MSVKHGRKPVSTASMTTAWRCPACSPPSPSWSPPTARKPRPHTPTACPSVSATASSRSKSSANNRHALTPNQSASRQAEQPVQHDVDVLGEERLEEEILGALGAGAILDTVIARSGHHHHLHVRMRGLEDVERGKAIDTWHLAVQKHDVEALFFRKLDRLRSISRLFDRKLAAAGLQHFSYDRAHRRRIVDNKHPLG